MQTYGFFRLATADPDRETLVAPDGTILTAGELHAARQPDRQRPAGHRACGPTTPSPWCCPTASRCSPPTSPAPRSGCYVTPINHHLVGPEIAYIVSDSEAKALLGHERFAGELAKVVDGAGRRRSARRSPIGDVAGLPAVRRARRRPARHAAGRPGRRRADALHVGHHRQAQGRQAGPGRHGPRRPRRRCYSLFLIALRRAAPRRQRAHHRLAALPHRRAALDEQLAAPGPQGRAHGQVGRPRRCSG